jgi:capsular exopolysaccharide synthesis family protein
MGTPVPEFPLPLTLGVGIFFGLLGGLGIVYALDLLDDRFRSPEELSAQLGVPVLAMIRELSVEASTGVEALVVHTAPQAIESEAFRTLRTTLAFSGEQRDRVAITSTEPGDGKTTIAANLGVSYALAGKRTLLIDADLRRPGLTKLFELRGQAGLADVLRSDEAVAELCGQWIQATGADGLDVLPSGPRPSNPAELLGGGRLSDVLAWAEGRYDQVIVDCPPILAASDAAIVGRLTDGLILAVQPHKTNRRLVLGAVQGLAAVGTGVVGVVVNRVDSEKGGGYYGYNYGYGYGYGYGCGYGHGDGRKHDDDDHEGEQSGQMGEPEAAQKPAGTLAIRRRAA